MPNRASGILTSTDFEFLHADGDYYTGEYAKQSKYDRQRAMRERIVRSILDFSEIRHYLGGEERQKIFANPEKNGADEAGDFDDALADLIGWLYLGCRETSLEFSDIIKRGVRGVEAERQGLDESAISVIHNLEVDHFPADIQQLAQDLRDGNPLNAGEVFWLTRCDNLPVDPEEIDVIRLIPVDNESDGAGETAIASMLIREHGMEAEVEIVNEATDVEANDNQEFPPENLIENLYSGEKSE